MIEQSQRPLAHPSTSDLDTLQRRAIQQHARHRQVRTSLTTRWSQARSTARSPINTLRRLPTRFLLHAVVALMLPLAVVLSQVPPGVIAPAPTLSPQAEAGAEFSVPVAPLSLQPAENLVGDAPIDDAEEIPLPLSLVSRNAALAPVVVAAEISAERIMLRNGPSTAYDAVGRMSGGTKVQVIGRVGDWFQVRESIDRPVYWVAGELLDIPPAAVYTLFEIPESALPPPPPPKIGFVRESGLQLRDGPGSNYVSMASLVPGQIDLLERYQDWLHVSVAGSEGWVKAEFIETEQAILDRLLVSETIPDPNPALVGTTLDNQINLRKGPDSRYDKVGMIDGNIKLDLIGKNKDWFRVQTPEGTKAWIFSDLLAVSSHVARRVPISNDFPKLPARAAASRPGASVNLAAFAASGDVAGYGAQFTGTPYIWGGGTPRGFDCSGFTRYVFNQVAGVNLPHSAAGQFSSAYGAFVGDMANLAPGDLVFFIRTTRGAGITHVGLYIGGGRIVHAISQRYGVQISNIYESYWSSRYYGGLRVRR